jgi:hypothetical protein
MSRRRSIKSLKIRETEPFFGAFLPNPGGRFCVGESGFETLSKAHQPIDDLFNQDFAALDALRCRRTFGA